MRDQSICKFSYSFLLKKIKDWTHNMQEIKNRF